MLRLRPAVGGPFEFAAKELRKLLDEGVAYLVKQGLATTEEQAVTESGGALEGADASAVSPEAYRRGADQCGTLGSGNHFAEVQIVEKIYDAQAAEALGLEQGKVTILLHTGSRGLGRGMARTWDA